MTDEQKTEAFKVGFMFAWLLLCFAMMMAMTGCVMTSSHYETSVTDPNGVTRTVYVHHGTSAALYDLSKLKVGLKLEGIGSLEVLGSVAEAQKIKDFAPTVAGWAAKGGL